MSEGATLVHLIVPFTSRRYEGVEIHIHTYQFHPDGTKV
jgi:hypothetical protein